MVTGTEAVVVGCAARLEQRTMVVRWQAQVWMYVDAWQHCCWFLVVMVMMKDVGLFFFLDDGKIFIDEL
jgi:hypothetical protein